MAETKTEFPELTEIDDVLARIHEHEAAIADLTGQLPPLVQALHQIDDGNRRNVIGAHMYWFMPEVKVKDIAFAMTGRAQQSAVVGLIRPDETRFTCAECAAPIPITTRQRMKEFQAESAQNARQSGHHWTSSRLLCGQCQAERSRAAKILNDELRSAHSARWSELRAMSYAEYLKTPEFDDRRQRALEERLKEKQHLTCNVCPSENEIGLYHKINMPIPCDAETILLCSTCKDALLEAGKIHPPEPRGHIIPARLIADAILKRDDYP